MLRVTMCSQKRRGDWWIYENADCEYSLLVHPNWELADEDYDCGSYFERYDGPDLVGTINIWAFGLESGETAERFR